MSKKASVKKPAVGPGITDDSMSKGWGAKVVHSRMPSGVKLVMEPDSDCILKFIGKKDISDRLDMEEGSVIYLIFYDGRRFVSMPCSYAFTEAKELQPGYWHYIWNQGEVEMKGRNPMKDFLILELGVDGEEIQVPPRVADSQFFVLNPADVAKVNYTRLNYPLRTVGKPATVETQAKE